MARIPYAILGLLLLALAPAPSGGQEGSHSWLDGEALMLDVLSPAASDNALLQQFHLDCRIAMDGVMARQIEAVAAEPVHDAPSCREPNHWVGVRQYVSEFRARNDTATRFMRPSGIGAPWMVRYAVRCRNACQDGMVGFEIRFTYDGRRVTRVELQAR